ncbi:MAG: nicotinate (nicotinamide) nucleotide adenylyltransferase [Ruminococcaceae bacterium]|nr:nicotinate (nicotinamide) nucleotide adenylyltransferase [Oscillospiraceae bacterium]
MINGIMRIGIYGGTFAPPHLGHVRAAEEFFKQMELDLLYIIPTAVPPHKQIDAADDPRHRLAMCELAFGSMPRVIVSDMEIVRGGKSYTVDTLRALAAQDRCLFLLMGTDMMLTLDQWREPEEIFRLCYPVYMRRENDPVIEGQIIAKNSAYLSKYGKIVRRIPMEFVDVSSTAVRERVAMGRSLTDMVPEAVAAYIEKEGLYV